MDCTSSHPDLRDHLKPGRHPWSDAYQDQQDSHDRCIVCGKKVGPNVTWVILGHGGNALIRPDQDHDHANHDNGYLGAWPVGPECGRSIPDEYRTHHDQLPTHHGG